MLHIFSPKDFNFAAKVKIGTLDKLVLATFFMSIKVLPLNFLATLVIAVNNLEKAPFIMLMEILVYDDGIAFLVRTIDSSKVTGELVRLHFLPFKSHLAAFFKQAIAFVRTVNCFQWAINAYMIV